MRIGNIYITKAYLGDIQLSPENAFLGIVPVIEAEEEPNYLTFTALEDSTIGINIVGNLDIPNLVKSTNGTDWEDWDGSEVSVSSGSKFHVKRKDGHDSRFSIPNQHHTFVMEGAFDVSGELTSLITGGLRECVDISEEAFGDLFNGCTALRSAENLNITYNRYIEKYAFVSMFRGCTNLTKAPKYLYIVNFSAGANGTCKNMFYGCTSLTEAPNIISKEPLCASGVFESMFSDCTSLESVNINVEVAKTIQGAYYSYVFRKFLDGSSIKSVYQYGGYRLDRSVYGVPYEKAIFYMNDGFSFDGNRRFDGTIIEATIAMRADNTWNISVDDSQWLGDASQYTIEPLEGNGNTPISVNLKRNMEGERSLILNATSESGETATITITQLEY